MKKTKFLVRIFFVFDMFYAINIIAMDGTSHHVICSLKKHAKNKVDQKKYNQKIHDATYAINLACKKLYKDDIEINTTYPHRRNTVFIIHFNHSFNNWTLFKPSFISYDQFIKLIKKIYASFGLQINCSRDQNVCISGQYNPLTGARYLSLDEFEEYKKISPIEIENNSKDEHSLQFEHYQNIKKMQSFFFWHLQIPTTGLYHDDRFDIDNSYKPLAWHFLLWDLAPKKGEGANVAIIDTGASAFNMQETEYNSLYKKNINITVPNNLQDYGYNLVSKDGLDPIRQIKINISNFCDHEKFDSNECMEKLPEMIIELLKSKDNVQFESYFIKNAKKQYLNEDQSALNKKGEEVLKNLLYGKYGVEPFGKDSFFHITHLQAPYNEEVLLETLPSPKITKDSNAFSAGHGTFTQGVVNGKLSDGRGITGLAPQAHVTMIKAFNDRGTTNKTTLNAALQRAITLKNPIVSMSLKITDEIDSVKDAHLKELIDSIDYVVAASGNDGQLKKLKNKEAYPAKFDSVAFDVGAFKYENNMYPICPFTQMELNIGPKFVAPGSNIFSSGLTPGQTQDSMYVFMTGTSIAVPVITGFLALVLAEFQDLLSREQILKVIYTFSVKLGDDAIWQKYIKVGTPDMRSTLLCLHVLQALQVSLQDQDQYSFKDHFNNLVQAIWILNYYVPSKYEADIACSLTHNLAGFVRAIQEKKPKIADFTFFTPERDQLSSTIDFMATSILHAINREKYNCPEKLLGHDALIESLQKVLHNKKLNLFEKLPAIAQARIKTALSARKSCLLLE